MSIMAAWRYLRGVLGTGQFAAAPAEATVLCHERYRDLGTLLNCSWSGRGVSHAGPRSL